MHLWLQISTRGAFVYGAEPISDIKTVSGKQGGSKAGPTIQEQTGL
jgi:hypothetical protein